jgi:hypothetical protein
MIDGLVREVFEEIKLLIIPKRLLATKLHIKRGRNDSMLVTFLCTLIKKSKEKRIFLSDEYKSFKFIRAKAR